jgi:hypothetical protein
MSTTKVTRIIDALNARRGIDITDFDDETQREIHAEIYEIIGGGSSVSGTSDERTTNNTVRHQYRVLSDEEKATVQRIKDAGEDLLTAIRSAGPSREISLAITKAEEAVMWSVKGVTA